MNVFISHLLLAAAIFCFFSCSPTTAPEEKHTLPVVFLDADKEELFSDSIGIYVKGIGRAANWQGMKANYFEGRKIQARFRYADNGDVVLDQGVKIKVSGGGSRKLAQKSFNIYGSKKLGKKYFDYPFFNNREYHKFSALRLRVSGQDWVKTHMRDALMHTITEDIDVYNQAYQPVVLYLNGRYWGIYNLREKFNKTYIRNKQSVDKSVNFDILERRWKISEGDSSEYMNMIRYIEGHSLAKDMHYDSITSMIDIPHYIDYVCAQIYFGNTDWPGNNIKFWKAKSEGAKWSWFMHDTDLGFDFAPVYGHPGGTNHNTFAFNMNEEEPGVIHNQPWATFLLRNLIKNESFRLALLKRMRYLLENDFSAVRVLQAIDKLQEQLSPEIEEHIERWKTEDQDFPQSVKEWEGNVEELRNFARFRPEIIKDYIEEYYVSQGWM